MSDTATPAPTAVLPEDYPAVPDGTEQTAYDEGFDFEPAIKRAIADVRPGDVLEEPSCVVLQTPTVGDDGRYHFKIQQHGESKEATADEGDEVSVAANAYTMLVQQAADELMYHCTLLGAAAARTGASEVYAKIPTGTEGFQQVWCIRGEDGETDHIFAQALNDDGTPAEERGEITEEVITYVERVREERRRQQEELIAQLPDDVKVMLGVTPPAEPQA